MWSLPKPSYDPDTIRAAALAYRREMQAGRLDGRAREGGVAEPARIAGTFYR